MIITMTMIMIITTTATQIPTISPIGGRLGSTVASGLPVDKIFSVDALHVPIDSAYNNK